MPPPFAFCGQWRRAIVPADRDVSRVMENCRKVENSASQLALRPDPVARHLTAWELARPQLQADRTKVWPTDQFKSLLSRISHPFRVFNLITAQLSVGQAHDMIGEPTIADAILDRIVPNVHRVNLEGDSRRKPKSASHLTGDENTKSPVISTQAAQNHLELALHRNLQTNHPSAALIESGPSATVLKLPPVATSVERIQAAAVLFQITVFVWSTTATEDRGISLRGSNLQFRCPSRSCCVGRLARRKK